MDRITREDYVLPRLEPPLRIPPAREPLEVAGPLAPATAAAMGLAAGVPVAVGTYDSWVDLESVGGESRILLGSTMIVATESQVEASTAGDLRSVGLPGGQRRQWLDVRGRLNDRLVARQVRRRGCRRARARRGRTPGAPIPGRRAHARVGTPMRAGPLWDCRPGPPRRRSWEGRFSTPWRCRPATSSNVCVAGTCAHAIPGLGRRHPRLCMGSGDERCALRRTRRRGHHGWCGRGGVRAPRRRARSGCSRGAHDLTAAPGDAAIRRALSPLPRALPGAAGDDGRPRRLDVGRYQ